MACTRDFHLSSRLQHRESLVAVSTILFAYGSTSAFMRMTYYIQMHDRFGPIVIHLPRVRHDVEHVKVMKVPS